MPSSTSGSDDGRSRSPKKEIGSAGLGGPGFLRKRTFGLKKSTFIPQKVIGMRTSKKSGGKQQQQQQQQPSSKGEPLQPMPPQRELDKINEGVSPPPPTPKPSTSPSTSPPTSTTPQPSPPHPSPPSPDDTPHSPPLSPLLSPQSPPPPPPPSPPPLPRTTPPSMQDPPLSQLQPSISKASSFIESIPNEREVEVVLSYSESGTGSPEKEADNAFLKALRGSTSMDEEEEEEGIVPPPPGTSAFGSGKQQPPAMNNDADDAFLGALRGREDEIRWASTIGENGDEGSVKAGAVTGRSEADNSFLRNILGASGENDGKGSGDAALTSSRGLSDADNSFLRNFQGVPSETNNGSKASSAGGLSDADNSFLRNIQGASGPVVSEASSAIGLSDADNSFLRNIQGAPEVNASEISIAGGLSDADNSFLRNIQGAPKANTSQVSTASDADSSFWRYSTASDGPSDADNSFLRNIRGSSASNVSKASTVSGGLSDADNSFLRNLQGASGENVSMAPTEAAKTSGGLSDADNSFLKNIQGNSEANVSTTSAAAVASQSEEDDSFLQNFRGASAEEINNAPAEATTAGGLTDADNSFLSNFHGASAPDVSKTLAVTTSGVLTDADKPILRNIQRDSVENTRKASSAGVLSDADNSFLRNIQGISGENTSKASAAGGLSDDDNSFLRNIQGASGENGNTSSPTGGLSAADTSFLRNIQGASGENTSKASSAGGLSVADTSFLRNFQGASGENTSKASSAGGLSVADNAFLQNFHGVSADPSSTSADVPRQAQPPPPKAAGLSSNDDDFLANMRGTPRVDSSEDPKTEVSNANAAFLGALHASSNPVSMQGGSNRAQYPDGSLILHSTSTSKMKKKRVQDPKQHKKRVEDPKQHKKQPESHADSDFLNAVRGSQFPDSSQNSVGDSYDSGTLVLNSPQAAKGAKHDVESSNSAFMMSVQTSAEDGDTNPASGDASGDVKEELDEDEDDEDDEDMEGLKIPPQPIVEKVMLPRPLFFGHRLPPRIMEEAVHAASMYTRDSSTSENRGKSAQVPAESPNNAGTASSAADDSSFVSRSSPSSVPSLTTGGKKFQSSVAPCCRNLEGALEVFGFGINPFTAELYRGEEDNMSEDPARPHPYVSIYSPVWDEWARAARVKSRRKKAKVNSKADAKADAEAQARLEAEAKSSKAHQISTGRRRMKSMSLSSVDMGTTLDMLSFGSKTERSQFDLHQSTVDTVDTAGSSISSSETPKTLTESTDDQFLRFARAGSADGVGEALSESTNDQFLRFARAGSADDAGPADGAGEALVESTNDQFLRFARAGSADGAGEALTESNNDQFLRFARAGSADGAGDSLAESTDDQFLRFARAGSADDAGSADGAGEALTESTDDQFLRFARAGAAGGAADSFVGSLNPTFNAEVNGSDTFVASQPPKKAFSVPPVMDSSTFVHAVKSCDDASDDDSIKADEGRKAVGNDNISAAIAMLAGEGVDDIDGDENRGIGTSMLLAAGGGAKSANHFGRPYSNFELMSGCVPEYGCDDPSLPHESDLGVFETKEEEKRSQERRREKNMIEEFAVPGVMPHVTCPIHCSGVDDSVSWNSRVTESDLGGRNTSNTMVISLDGNSSSNPDKLPSGQNKSQMYETSRCAWWNLPDSFDGSSNTSVTGDRNSSSNRPTPVAEIFPALDDPIPLDVKTNLWPPLNLLRENNMSGTRSHPATSTARFLPHLSDRPPSVRHLQIDTTAVGFPKLGGEIEPMFCKLSIYHFEMSTEKSASHSGRRDSDSATSTSSYAPSPNMERCGQVTESLHFDVIQDPKVIQNCKHALWPYAKESDLNVLGNFQNDTQTEGTPCGMFPLPANLSISSLYAVIIVHKVIGESADLQPYYKPGRHESQMDVDLERLRDSAKTACDQNGHFTTPFAFGVVPLKHIIGDESPKVPVTRAVQIPLFKFDPGRGPQSIFDHILLMLHPRAEPRGGKPAPMTKGHALLLMRYFGYLGLHSILKKKSSLARERLVDFTGELQVKCKSEKDAEGGNVKEKPPVLGETYILPPWQNQYKVEPASFGGRNLTKPKRDGVDEKEDVPNSLYAQEIAALPLERPVPESSSRGRNKSTHRNKYDGMLLHRSFCNELVCKPAILQKCPKKNIVIKVELRELQWNENINAEIAIPTTPSIHNTRRGPWLVHEAFTSCAMGTPQFLDEFKIKLPLVLGAPGHGRLGLLFSVYHLNSKKKRRNRLIRRPSDTNGNKPESGYSIERLGSGFLPLTLENSPTCIIANGDHDVPIKFRACELADMMDRGNRSSPRHRKKFSFGEIGGHFRSWSSSSDNDELRLSKSGELKCEQDDLTRTLSADENYPVGSLALTRLSGQQVVTPHADGDTQEAIRNADDYSIQSGSKSSRVADEVASTGASSAKGLRPDSSAGDLQLLGGSQRSESSTKDSSENEMTLCVNVIAISSVHAQNKILADLFLTKPNPPRSLMPSDFSEPYAPWGKYRSEILYRLKPERIPPFNFVGGALAETERKLLEPVVSLAKSSKCPQSDLMTHLVRIVAQLWRTSVSGVGEPSILWASPESLIPLRLNAFATLLNTVSSASHHMAKSGLRQLDGNATWDIMALGKILSLLFDEWALFGGPLEDAQNVKTSVPKKSTLSKPENLSTRAKTGGRSSLTRRPNIVERYSSEESPKPSQKKIFDVDALLGNFSTNTNMGEDTVADSYETNPLTSGESGFTVDSKNDFMSALTAASLDPETDSSAQKSTTQRAEKLLKPAAPAIGPASSRRRWMTLPLNALATIEENDGENSRVGNGALGQKSVSSKKGDLIDTELILHPGQKKKSRQMRVPEVDPNGIESLSSFLDLDSLLPHTEKKQDKVDDPPLVPDRQRTPATDDGVIEVAGTAFLDSISSWGFGNGSSGKEMGGEERRVGAAHHRKTRSRCSIDWSLPPTDMLLEKDQQVEQFNRTRAGDLAPTILPLSPIGSFPDDASSDDDSENGSNIDSSNPSDTMDGSTLVDEEANSKKEHPLKKHQRATSQEDSFKPAEVIFLPDFADRMSVMKNNGDKKRWWPYVYEVIIHQWVALLDEQKKKGEGAGKKPEEVKHGDTGTSGISPIVVKYLSHAAKAARGATIRCAPFLLEIIKQSLSWRVDCVFRGRKKMKPSLDETSCENAVPPLVKLDENIMSALEKLITMLTDASVDSRNFDSFEYRKISIDVNDAVVRFIRDLFSILDAQLVHRLVLVYFARFVTKEGKHWNDRDSKVTGLCTSWETTKLRLNAITLFIRFPEFMGVCSPIMESWTLPVGSSVDSARRFFSDALEKISRLGLSKFTSPDGPVSKEPIAIPRMKPHWLAELCTDICLSATGHAEESIQFRASSLLFELFWRHSEQGRFKGNISVVASVFVPLVPKVLSHIDYLSTLPAKGQLRKDIIPCILFVLQSAPVGLMRALWRKLAKRAEGNTLTVDSTDKYGGIIGSGSGICGNAAFSSLLPHSQTSQINEDFEMEHEVDIFDMFGLLNLSLSTIEYEGSGNQVEENNGTNAECDEKSIWRREFLLSSHVKATTDPRSRPFKNYQPSNGVGETDSTEQLTTLGSRRWHAHDSCSIIINICRQIVREILGMLKPNLGSTEDTHDGDFSCAGISGSRSLSDIFLQPTSSSLDDSDSGSLSGVQHEEGKASRMQRRLRKRKLETLTFAVSDTIIFVRAATSVYLHALSMKQSDIVIKKTLTASVEIVKIFGIKLFLSAIGETLQHWMRVVLEHCGARRADLRVETCEFLNLLLRLTWDSYGSFTRIRLPLLAVQSEVMERIVAKAANNYVMEQRRLGLNPITLSNESAEASLTPLWRTIDRLHNKSASRNLSFKSALARLAIKMKKVYQAYLAAHALAIVNRSELGNHGNNDVTSQTNPYAQRMRVSVHRIVSNSAWFSKRFLGKDPSASLDRSMIQTEAVEDAFLIAADVFSSTELPSHRVAWLEKLSEFHRMRGRFAEEATCRCYIYHTYREAAKQHDHIWSSSPFLPWASNNSSDGHAIVSDFDFDTENSSSGSGKQIDRATAFRRIFYRATDSVRVRSGDWGAVGRGKYLFYGITLKSEFDSISPWYSHREMEENMVEEAEISGDLYLRAGIVESSRYAWSLANQYYSETFNYARLAYVYRRLALVVTSQVPIIDISNQLDLSSQIGRFYKVYFHGSAPDDLLQTQGSEGFIYRVPNSVQIKDFASRLESAVRCILPNKTTIDLLLDDGSPTLTPKSTGSKSRNVIGGAPIDPVKIKVTPLRPLFKTEDNEKCFRGTPEWFQLKCEEHENEAETEGSVRNSGGKVLPSLQHQRSQSTSTTNSLSSVGSLSMPVRRSAFRSTHRKPSHHNPSHDKGGVNGELIGIDRFYFTQPMKKDPARGFRDWLKVPNGRIAERSLRVTELQVGNSFPACITRQKIIHRAVFTQSPLEASVEAVSTWCSVLFRTVIATNGQGVLGGQRQQGLSADSAKLVMECIHSSGVKRIGITFLTVNAQMEESNMEAGMYSPYEALDVEEIEMVQIKLARMIVTFVELLHLLIGRNRDVLLAVVHSRKRGGGDNASVASGSIHGGYAATPRTPMKRQSATREVNGSTHGYMYDRSNNEIHASNNSDRTDSAIGVQSELQRGFTSLVKALSPILLDKLMNNEVPRWIREVCQDTTYWSRGKYRNADIPIGDELFFNVDTSGDDARGSKSEASYAVPRSIRGIGHTYREGSPNGSLCSGISERRIDRTLSSTSERPPTDRSAHRRNISGTPSYVSSKGT